MNRTGKILLVAALVGVVGMAFRVSWNALRDVATATGADPAGAILYPIVVDGLMALALIATLVLAGPDRRYALRVLATYTVASLVLNYVHGLVPELHAAPLDWGRLADWDPANWLLVLLATSLPVGSIYFGSDLVAKVLHHRPPAPDPVTESVVIGMDRSTPDLRESTPPEIAPMFEKRAVEAPRPVADAPSDESAERVPVGAVAAESRRPRAATGRVPKTARTPRPVRTADQLLSEAREATAGWPDADLTGEAIRKAVHTSAAKARVLRDALRAERADTSGVAA